MITKDVLNENVDDEDDVDSLLLTGLLLAVLVPAFLLLTDCRAPATACLIRCLTGDWHPGTGT